MKKLCLILLIAVLGCSSDDDANSAALAVNDQNIVGRWYIAGGTINGVATEYDHECATSRDFQDFLPNHTITFNGYNSACDLVEIETSGWNLSGNTLTITSFDPIISGPNIFTVQSLTANELVLRSTYNSPDGENVELARFVRN